jgi:hypothetical protein
MRFPQIGIVVAQPELVEGGGPVGRKRYEKERGRQQPGPHPARTAGSDMGNGGAVADREGNGGIGKRFAKDGFRNTHVSRKRP